MILPARVACAAALACTIVAAGPNTARAGASEDYMLYCMGCHGAAAEGVPGKVPPLAGVIGRFMRSPVGRDYILRVPGAANSALSDGQLAAVLNWIARTYDGAEMSASTPPFTVQEVTRSRHTPLASVLATRRSVIKSLAAEGTAPPSSY